MKDYLTKLIARKNKELADLKKRNDESEDINEVKSIGSQIEGVNAEIADAQAQLDKIEAEENKEEKEEMKEEERSAFNPAAATVVASAKIGETRSEETDELSSMEYRKAFMNYVQRGTKSEILKFEQRSGDESGVAEDLGVLLPKTVVQEIIKGVEKVYGQLYSRVRKLNIKGGVRFPIGSFSAKFSRITENGKSDRQKAGEVDGYVQFTYNIGEIRIATSLLQSVLSVPVFEQEVAKVIIEAYVEAMDYEIMHGDSDDGECEGILTEAAKGSSGRIPAANIIEFTEADMADWKKWQEKLFAKIPLSMRALNPEFVMTANTYEANIKTLADNNDRPVYTETFNPVDGAEISRFKGKDVVFVEEDILDNFDDEDAEYFGMFWVPEKAYAINTNMEFTMRRYFDEELNQYVDKALVINDGKVLDPKYIYLLKKSAE